MKHTFRVSPVLVAVFTIALLALAATSVNRVLTQDFAATTDKKRLSAAAPTISFVSVPTVLPRDTPFAAYSPLLAIQYDGLASEKYTLKVHLLTTDLPPPNFPCGCDPSPEMWCPASFIIDNQNGTNSSGKIMNARITNVHDRVNFLWVADLHNQEGTIVSTATQAATSTLNRAPVLSAIGDKTIVAGQSLSFTVSASDPDGDGVTLSAQNLPPGATFNHATGQFHWQPAVAGAFSSIGFVAAQVGATPLSDAELINIQVGNPPPPGVLSFSAGSYSTGESGPGVLTVNRANGDTGAVTVAYSTINGSAFSGSDFVGISGGPITFASGETVKTIRVPTVNDTNIEPNESFQVQLSAPTGGATIGAPSMATVNIVDDDNPQLAGHWSGVLLWPTVPIHMHLLPTGKVMFWDRHHHTFMWDGTPKLWDPAMPPVFNSLPLPQQPGWDLFCSGHTLLADGRLLVTGGHIEDGVGALNAGSYDSAANSWAALPNMNAGRWYPNNTILANGDVLVIAGTTNGVTDINPLPQVWQVSTGTWRNLTSAMLGTNPIWPDFYPFVYLAPNGKVFLAGPQKTSRYLDTANTGSWTNVANSSLCYRDYGSSVLYDAGKVLLVGGNPRDDCDPPNLPLPIFPSATAEVINLNLPNPTWREVASMSVGRRQHNTTILPDGKVLVTGGTSTPGFDDHEGAVLYAELWDPNTEAFTPMAAQTRYRGYHSGALLLPDGRVLVAGGGHPPPPTPSGGTAQDNAEIYSPPYLFKGPRPAITAAPTRVNFGQTFFVQTPDAVNINSVNWIRLTSVTHGFNQNQRINRLNFSQAPDGLNVIAPSDPNLCPPGHYMLFILNGNGVPSIAKIVQILDSVTPTVQFAAASFNVQESGGSASIVVSRSGDASNAATVEYATSDSASFDNCNVISGAASSRCDYARTFGALHFAPGEVNKNIHVLITDDAYAEGNETFSITLSNPSGAIASSPVSTTVTISDNETVNGANPIDLVTFFVRQHYVDFLNREPDPAGLAFWVNEITSCGTDAQCIENKRINVSAAFFFSIEFQETGYLVYRMFKSAYGDAKSPNVTIPVPIIRLNEFLPDAQRIGEGVRVGIGDWQAQLEANKNAYARAFVVRQRFLTDFPLTMTAEQFVDKLNLNSGNVLSQAERDQLIVELNAAGDVTQKRASVVRKVADDTDLKQRENNRAFVLMQYYGYLRRNPNDPQDTDFRGWEFWLNKLNQFNGNFVQAEMVKAFITSIEFRRRFGP